MQFKRVARLSGLSLLIASIVVPAGSSVNQNATTNGATQMHMADGMPLPPLPPPLPPSGKGSSPIADGMPLPPLPPSKVDVIGRAA